MALWNDKPTTTENEAKKFKRRYSNNIEIETVTHQHQVETRKQNKKLWARVATCMQQSCINRKVTSIEEKNKVKEAISESAEEYETII